MAFEILATIVGQIADEAEAQRLARDIGGVVSRAQALGCVVEIRDVRLGRELQRIVCVPDEPRAG